MQYSLLIRYASLKYTILEALSGDFPGLHDAVSAYFYYKRHDILEYAK